MAVDRGNASLASRFQPLHPAVLRLIKLTFDAATSHGIDIGVCGEMASEPVMAFALIGLGLRQLSVAPRSVPRVKKIVRTIHAAGAASAAKEALGAASAAVAEAGLRRRLSAETGS
jgi:phosphotransferase system enzyme I (PtsI)